MWALKLLAVLAALYGALALIAYAAQTSLLFPTGAVGSAPPLGPGAETIACDTSDGERLQGVRLVPSVASPGPRTLIMGFAGNAWNAEDMAGYLHELFPAVEVVAFHYRGYRPSTGRPGAAALLEDAPRVYDCAIPGRGEANVVAVGFSIGSGVAAHLASKRPLAGLVLVTPFDSLEQLAREHYGWLPVRILLRHRMSPVDDLRQVAAPVALIAAERDTLIPQQRTEPLRKAARSLVLDRTIAGAGHNDIYANPEFARAMHQAIALIEDRAKADRARRP
jgi:pimeloyl-ACP methyl ester carboxylesterase